MMIDQWEEERRETCLHFDVVFPRGMYHPVELCPSRMSLSMQ